MSSPHVDVVAASPVSRGVVEIGGQEVALAYSDAGAEYDAIHSAAVVVDRSFRGRMRFFGEKSGEALTGLVTSDVLAATPGHGHYAAALTAKGRILADVRIFAVEGSYLVDTPPRAWPGFLQMVKKYVNPRLSGYRDDSHPVRDVGVFGQNARAIVASLAGIDAAQLAGLAPFDSVPATIHDAAVTVARVPDLGVEGYELFVPFETVDRIRSDLVALGATPAGLTAWEIARVEAGRPEWGIDIDDTTIPQEANFDELEAISYTKGCYTGQEVVARVHFRGHVNRHLRGLRSTGTPAAPPAGAQLIDDTGHHVGDVRSAVTSPRFGGIAIGMVRREIERGTLLIARTEASEHRVEVVALPFTG